MGFDLNGYRIQYNDRNNRRKTSMTKWSWEPGRPALKTKQQVEQSTPEGNFRKLTTPTLLHKPSKHVISNLNYGQRRTFVITTGVELFRSPG